MKPIECPCCSRPVSAPTLDLVVEHLRVPPMQARILEAVWRGRGQPVQTGRIIAAMDRGTDRQHDSQEFKIALHHLRKRLRRAGIAIKNTGYARGYRIEFTGQSHAA